MRHLQKINKITINKDDSFYDMNVLTYFDQSIAVNSFSNENEAYYEFDLFSPTEKVKNPSVQTEMTDIFAQMSVAAHHNNPPVHNSIIRDENNDVGIWTVLSPEARAGITYPVETDEQARDGSSDTLNNINDLQNNEEEWARSDIKQSTLELAREQIESVLGKSANQYSQDQQTQENYENTITKYFAILHYVFDLTLSQMHLNSDIDTNTGIPIPLKYTFTLDGIAGIVQGQCFRISPVAFPISYSIGGDHDYYTYVVMSVSHEFVGNHWDTTISGIMYVSKAGATSMLSDISKETIQQAKTTIAEEKTSVILANLKGGDTIPEVKLEPSFTQPVKADMDKFKIDGAIKDKKASMDALKGSIDQAQVDYASGKESLEYHEKKMGKLKDQLDKSQSELEILNAVKNQIDEGINDLDTYILNQTQMQVPMSKDAIIKNESLKNGILAPLMQGGVVTASSSLLDATGGVNNVGMNAQTIASGISNSVSAGSELNPQTAKVQAMVDGLNSVSQTSKTVSTMLESSNQVLPTTDTVKEASVLTQKMTQELTSLKNLAPSTGIGKIAMGNQFVELPVALDMMIVDAQKSKMALDQTSSIVNPQTGKLSLDSQMSIDFYKTADLSTIPDGYMMGVKNQQVIKQKRMTFTRASRMLGSPR